MFQFSKDWFNVFLLLLFSLLPSCSHKNPTKSREKKQAKMKQKLQKNFKLDEGFKNGLMVSARPTPNIF